MKKWLKDAIQAFIKADIDSIRNYTLKFAQEITRAILDDDKGKIEQLIDNSSEFRDNIELSEEIDRNKEFYYGYWYAYENIANRIVDHNDTNDNIHKIIESNERLRSLVKFLGKEKAAKQKDIAKHLSLKPNELANFMETDYVKKSDILSKNKIGRNVIYSLNAKGRKYFENQTSDVINNYSKEDIFNIIEYIKKGNNKSELLIKESPGLDESVIRMIYNLSINEEILDSSKYKKDIYIKNENIKRQNKSSRRSELTYINIPGDRRTDENGLLSA